MVNGATVKAKTIAAFDLGTNCGWAVGTPLRVDGQGTKLSGTWPLKPIRYEGGGMRAVRFVAQLNSLYAALPFELVFFEEVRRHAGTDAAHVYGGLMMTLQAWCEEKAIPYAGVPVGAIKAFATGKGNATKAQVIEAVKKWGYAPDTDDEADAIALLQLKLGELG